MALLDLGNCWSRFWVTSGGVESWSSFMGGMAANAGGNCRKVWPVFFHGMFTFISHPQYKRTHDSMSTAPAKDIASADTVLTATFWIFSECHTEGLTGPVLLIHIGSWQATIIISWWEPGCLFDENDASEQATNLSSCTGIGCIFIVTSAWCLASCNVLFASTNVDTWARLILGWSHQGGYTCQDGCWRQHAEATQWLLSSSVVHLQIQGHQVSFFGLLEWKLGECCWCIVSGWSIWIGQVVGQCEGL